jgi:hypothetical protein
MFGETLEASCTSHSAILAEDAQEHSTGSGEDNHGGPLILWIRTTGVTLSDHRPDLAGGWNASPPMIASVDSQPSFRRLPPAHPWPSRSGELAS